MSTESAFIDQPGAVRPQELPHPERLQAYLHKEMGLSDAEVLQFPGGYSNITFLIRGEGKEFILRKPPQGANIKSAHDMGREFQVLTLLKPLLGDVPTPLAYCDDETVIGSPFYLMERVKGVILRNRIPKGLDPEPATFRKIGESAVDRLAALHNLDIEATGLIRMGKPEGYVQRQVEGWIRRYHHAKTDEIPGMQGIEDWLLANQPGDGPVSFIHNDFKFDNLVLDPTDLSRILAILDWEMATVGHPLMDLGTSLAYWAGEEDPPALKPFNLTWMSGNLSRQEVLDRYAEKTGSDLQGILFHYVFGCYKISVIVQQIYARYQKGLTTDPRFSGLGHVVMAFAENASKAILYKRVSNFY